MRLLLAEDEKEMAHALEAVFTHNHYSVDVVYNGIDAADWAESGNYDGMILDIMMPGKSGLEVLREWTESIHHQIERLNSLVTQLLTLAKMEEGGGELELKTWNASETIMDAVTSFEASVVTKQIALQSDIAEEVHMEGDAARIHQLVSLPCRKVISTASLAASTVRMRRGPGERGGYGIGLSVAAAIVKAHKGKITAERTRDGICFKAVFPAKG